MDATGVLLSVSNCMNIVWGIRDLILIFSHYLQSKRDFAAEMTERRSKEKELIKSALPPGRAAANESFFFVDFQSLCEMSINGEKRYLPCEVALVEFSLVSGVKRKLHKFIDPGKYFIVFV